jgi:lipoprotein-releasing system ATP-binding protein
MLLKLDQISKSYGSPSEGSFRKVLDCTSLEVFEGESIAILGPSGSGKTTLLNIIGSLDHPDNGRVFYKDEDITGFSEKEMNAFRNSQIGFIFQLHHLLPQCTVLENILLPTLAINDKAEKNKRLEHAYSLIKRMGLWEQLNQKPGHLSGGECQRTAVIRAMINSPSLLLADEPTGALDAENAEKLAELLLEINKLDKVALIVVTHSRSLAERMHSVYELKNGQLVKQNF